LIAAFILSLRSLVAISILSILNQNEALKNNVMLYPIRQQNLEPAFVLHSRPYRETSVLLTFFTKNLGKVAAIGRSVRQARSHTAGLLMPFVPLMVILRGRGELMNVQSVEAARITNTATVAIGNNNNTKTFFGLKGRGLFYGLYLNELLIHMLERNDPHPNLYCCYQESLLELQHSCSDALAQQITLRLFEKKLLQESGYGLQLNKTSTGEAVAATEWYNFQAGIGLTKVRTQPPRSCNSDYYFNHHNNHNATPQENINSDLYFNNYDCQTTMFKGDVLLELHYAHMKPPNQEQLNSLKQILSMMLYNVLGKKFLQCSKILELAE